MRIVEVFLMSLIRIMANEYDPGENMKAIIVKSIFIIYCFSHFASQIYLEMLVATQTIKLSSQKRMLF